MDMQQVQPQWNMQAVEEAPHMLVGMGNFLNMKDLLHLFSTPGADGSWILRRIYLKAF